MKRIFLAAAVAALCFGGMASAQPTTFNPTPGVAGQYNTVLGAINGTLNARTKWSYAAASGGIVNSSTGVTIKAAAGPGKRNYIQSCQFMNAGSGASGTEVLLEDGASGTVLWRGWIGTLQSREATFRQPLPSTANTLFEVKSSSATNVTLYVNCQGYTD